ncbi:MAG: kynureninase, partial [Actinomycetota bacterium]|nr:kynureninase [Actinomycetota bacterium]
MRELLDYRDEFPILADTTYLINHSLGAMPADAERRLAAYAEAWKRRGIRAWGEGWWELPLTVGDQIARLIGAPPRTVAMHQNVTIAVAVALSCFDFGGARRRIVSVEGEFPSVRYLLQAQQGAEVVTVPNLEALVEAIDERTLLVVVSHVLFKNAEIQDVAAVSRSADDAGA